MLCWIEDYFQNDETRCIYILWIWFFHYATFLMSITRIWQYIVIVMSCSTIIKWLSAQDSRPLTFAWASVEFGLMTTHSNIICVYEELSRIFRNDPYNCKWSLLLWWHSNHQGPTNVFPIRYFYFSSIVNFPELIIVC